MVSSSDFKQVFFDVFPLKNYPPVITHGWPWQKSTICCSMMATQVETSIEKRDFWPCLITGLYIAKSSQYISIYSTIIPLNDSISGYRSDLPRRSQRSMNWRSSHLADLGRFRWGINWGFWVEIAGVDTLWLCQNSYWTWPFIDDFPIKDGDFP